MLFFQKIKNYFSSSNAQTQRSASSDIEDSQKIIYQLTTSECLDVAGGPQVRNEMEI